jgi:hypothetical protein
MQLAELSKKKFDAERGVTLVSHNEVVPTSGITNQAAFVNNFIEGSTFEDIKRGGRY